MWHFTRRSRNSAATIFFGVMATIAALLQYGQWLMLILRISLSDSKYAVRVIIRSMNAREFVCQRGVLSSVDRNWGSLSPKG